MTSPPRDTPATSTRPRRDRYGALELALAIALFVGSAGFAGFARMHGLELTRRGRETDVALMHLTSGMERLLAADRAQLQSVSRASGNLESELEPKLNDQLVVARFPGWKPETSDDHCPIVLTISWMSAEGERKELVLRCSKNL